MSNAGVKSVEETDPSFEDIWMSEDRAIALIHQKTGVSISKDDPVLAVVEILNVFRDDMTKLLEAERALFSAQFKNDVRGVGDAVDTRIESVAANFKKLASSLNQDTVQSVISAVAQHSIDSERVRRTLKNGFLANGILASMNWFAVAAFYLILK